MITKAILSFSFFLQKSKKYRKIKANIYDLLNNSANPYKKYLDTFIIFLIITSVFILVY